MSEVRVLLEVSHAAHKRYREFAGRIDKKGHIAQHPDLIACGHAVRDALKARADAHALDPAHTDPAWHENEQAMRASHDALVDFYVGYLARASAA